MGFQSSNLAKKKMQKVYDIFKFWFNLDYHLFDYCSAVPSEISTEIYEKFIAMKPQFFISLRHFFHFLFLNKYHFLSSYMYELRLHCAKS